MHFEGTPLGFSADGCSSISGANPQELMLDGALVDTGFEHVQTFSPDHAQFIGIVAGDGATYFLVDIATGEQTELTPDLLVGAHLTGWFASGQALTM